MRLLNLLASALLFAAAADAATLSGRVYDVGAPDRNKDGIAAVRIEVLDGNDGKSLASTNTSGFYRINNLPALKKARVVFTKIGYRIRPTEVPSVFVTGNTTLNVRMIKEGASRAYHETVAARLAELLDEGEKRATMALVEALDDHDRSAVMTAYNAIASPAEAKIQIAGLTLVEGYAIPGVTVSAFECAQVCAKQPVSTTITDTEGHYAFENLKKTRYVVRADVAGAKAVETTVQASSALTVRNLPMAFDVSEAITVTAEPVLTADDEFRVIGAEPRQPIVFRPVTCEDGECPSLIFAANRRGEFTRRIGLRGEYMVTIPDVDGEWYLKRIDFSSDKKETIDTSKPPEPK